VLYGLAKFDTKVQHVLLITCTLTSFIIVGVKRGLIGYGRKYDVIYECMLKLQYIFIVQ
jgi:hypothetical protein